MQTLKVQTEDKWQSKFKEESVKDSLVKMVKAGHNTLDKLEIQVTQSKWSPPKESKAFSTSPRSYISGYITNLVATGVLVRVGEKDKPKVAPKAVAKPAAPKAVKK